MPHWTLPAILDVQEAWNHIAADNEVAADRILNAIIASTDRLDRFPRLGRPGPDAGKRTLVIPRTPYKVFYRIVDRQSVELLRVLHNARKWPP